MGNCMRAQPPEEIMMGSIKIKSQLEVNQGSLISRLEAVEGTLYIYKSILSRNMQQVKEEIEKMQNLKNDSGSLDISSKRLKLHQELANQLETQRRQLSEIHQNFIPAKRRTESLQVLANTYAFIQDLENLINLEDLLSTL